MCVCMYIHISMCMYIPRPRLASLTHPLSSPNITVQALRHPDPSPERAAGLRAYMAMLHDSTAQQGGWGREGLMIYVWPCCTTARRSRVREGGREGKREFFHGGHTLMYL